MTINDLRPGVVFEFEGEPWKVMKTTHVHMGRGSAVLQAKIRNIINGRVVERTFRARDEVKQADVDTQEIMYLYRHRGEFWFCDMADRSKRFSLSAEIIGESGKFFKPNSPVNALKFKEKIVGIELPIKMTFKVAQAPPAVKGDTQGGVMKQVKLENGAVVSAPIFIKEGDTIVVNTESGEYVQRA